VLLSGYCPSAALVHQVDAIGQAQRRRARDAGTGTGTGFFWVCDPVMGDNGRLYVAAETVPAYRDVVRRADLVLPNQFEAELLSGVEIVDGRSLREAVGVLHGDLGVPHVVVTSLRLGGGEGEEKEEEGGGPMLSVVGSTATAEGTPRLFRIQVQAMPVFFSGTGDMFAALLVGRLREAALRAGVLDRVSWMSPDGVAPTELPLAKATAKVLASMGAVLKDTERHYRVVKKAVEEEEEEREREKENGRGGGVDAAQEWEKEKHLRLTRAAEVRVVRNARALREPPNVEAYAAAEVD
jgi:pyridoxine kinase